MISIRKVTWESRRDTGKKKGHIRKQTVGQFRYRTIDSSDLYDNRKSPLEEGEENFAYGCWIKLFSTKAFFSTPSEGHRYSYSTLIESTACNYGGSRHWFLCPNPGCKRRCRKLYLNRQGYFFCRKCLNLAYHTQNRSKLDRIIDKKWALLRKFGADSGFLSDNLKPKGMHWKTFDSIKEQIEDLEVQAVRGIAKWCGMEN